MSLWLDCLWVWSPLKNVTLWCRFLSYILIISAISWHPGRHVSRYMVWHAYCFNILEFCIVQHACCLTYLLVTLLLHVLSIFWTNWVTFRLQLEAELKQLEEETARRLEEEIRKRVEEKLSSEEVKLEIERRIEEGHRKLFEDVEIQLEKEKQASLTEARLKEVSFSWAGYWFLTHCWYLLIITACELPSFGDHILMRSYMKDITCSLLPKDKYFNCLLRMRKEAGEV